MLGQCGRRQARQKLLSFCGVVAVPQSTGSGSLGSALSFFLGLFAHWPVRSLEPKEEVICWVGFGIWQGCSLGAGELGFEAYHWDPKPLWVLASQNWRIKFRHSNADRK